ncbi:MFS transporter [Tistrella mobilis]|jgi:MFS family permease|uniref:MFS transporter n=1 Tax=Tistrella mobilis TaxID=171437 RepID=UPI003555F847
MARNRLKPLARALAAPAYRQYTIGNATSLIGMWVQRLAIGWMAWKLTGSGAWLGVLAMCELLPTVILSPAVGALADRLDRRRLIIATQSLMLIQSLTAFTLVATGLITIGWLVALGLVLGVVTAFGQPARLALVPELVPRDDLPAAVALNASLFNLARFLGPAIAAPLLALEDGTAAFAAYPLTLILFLVQLIRLRVPAAENAGTGRARTATRPGLIADFRDGLAFAVRHAGIGPLLALLCFASLGARALPEILPALADGHFGAGAGGYAAFTAAIGIGALAAGLWMAIGAGERRLVQVAVVATALGAAGTALSALAPTEPVAIALLTLVGFAITSNGISIQTLLQLHAPPDRRGRVIGLYLVVMRGVPALGALVIGSAADLVGITLPLLAAALIAAAGAARAWTRLPRIEAGLAGSAASGRSES